MYYYLLYNTIYYDFNYIYYTYNYNIKEVTDKGYFSIIFLGYTILSYY